MKIVENFSGTYRKNVIILSKKKMFWTVVINADHALHWLDCIVCMHRTVYQKWHTNTKGHVIGYGQNFNMFDAL